MKCCEISCVKLKVAKGGLHGAGGGGDAASLGGGEVAGEGEEVEVDERVAHGVLEGVPRRPPPRVPSPSLVEPRGGGGGGGAACEGEEEAKEEQQGVDGGGEEGGGQGGQQVERLHCCCFDLWIFILFFKKGEI